MMRDCQMVSSREGTMDVMSGRARESSRQYQEVARKDRRPSCSRSTPPHMAAVACASVPETQPSCPISGEAQASRPSSMQVLLTDGWYE